ncbi:hypothetical protein Hanom_Chr14g01288281 [Helianthus anomalus]
MAMGICRQGSLSGGELGREIPSAVRGTVQLPFFFITHILEFSHFLALLTLVIYTNY